MTPWCGGLARILPVSDLRSSAASLSSAFLLGDRHAQLGGRKIDTKEAGGNGREQIAIAGRHMETIEIDKFSFGVQPSRHQKSTTPLAQSLHRSIEIALASAVKTSLEDALGRVHADGE